MTTPGIPVKLDANVKDSLKYLTVEELQQYQKAIQYPFAFASINFNGDLNLGVSIRSAVIFGASDYFIFGNKVYDKRSTVGAHNYINIHKIKTEIVNFDIDRDVVINTLTEHGYTPVAVEQNYRYTIRELCEEYNNNNNFKPCFIMGNEGYGLSKKFIGEMMCVDIPQYGVIRSLNVSAASSIIAYEWRTSKERS